MELIAYAIDGNFTLKLTKCLFTYNNRDFLFYAGDKNKCDLIITIIEDNKEEEELFETINKFLIRFCWANGCFFKILNISGKGLSDKLDLYEQADLYGKILNYPRMSGKKVVNLHSIMEPKTKEQEIALSLYNDAKSSNDFFYRFLCFWKILEIKPSNFKYKNPGEWINHIIEKKNKKNINILIDGYVDELIKNKENIGNYFFKNFRCAIAHINEEPLKLSFRQKDYLDVRRACYAIENFAEYFIRYELDLPKYCDLIEIKQEEIQEIYKKFNF